MSSEEANNFYNYDRENGIVSSQTWTAINYDFEDNNKGLVKASELNIAFDITLDIDIKTDSDNEDDDNQANEKFVINIYHNQTHISIPISDVSYLTLTTANGPKSVDVMKKDNVDLLKSTNGYNISS